jgi:hypothetical protein
MFLGFPDPNPDTIVDTDPDPASGRFQILLSSSKNSKKNIDSYFFLLLYDFLALKNLCKYTFKK